MIFIPRWVSNMRFSSIFSIWSVIFLLPTMPSAKTLTIPGDANSIQEAVEMAVSGDEIILVTTTVDWIPTKVDPHTKKPEYISMGGIQIQDKNLRIASGLPGRRTEVRQGALLSYAPQYPPGPYPSEADQSLLWIVNSHVSLVGIDLSRCPYIERFTPALTIAHQLAPIRLKSGSLLLQDCSYNGFIESNSFLSIYDSQLLVGRGVSEDPYGGYEPLDAGLEFSDSSQLLIHIENSFISGITTIGFKKIKDSNLNIINSQVVASIRSNYRRGEGFLPSPGAAGIFIQDCINLNFHLTNSTIKGGKGSGPEETGQYQVASRGGDGIQAINSTVSIQGGTIQGGEGGDEFIQYASLESPTYLYGQGGNGLSLSNSTVMSRDAQFIGGLGGGVPLKIPALGLSGAAIFLDEFSTFQEITVIPEWSLF